MLNGLPPFYDEDVQEMYTKILSAELEIPDFIRYNSKKNLEHSRIELNFENSIFFLSFFLTFFSDEAADLLVKLLDREPKTRLQQPPQIKAHAFFAKIDWKLLLEKKFLPPWVPEVKGVDYTGNIDESFLLEAATIHDEGILFSLSFSFFSRLVVELFYFFILDFLQFLFLIEIGESSGDVKETDDGEFEGFTYKGAGR